jgi:hypothetical protein
MKKIDSPVEFLYTKYTRSNYLGVFDFYYSCNGLCYNYKGACISVRRRPAERIDPFDHDLTESGDSYRTSVVVA